LTPFANKTARFILIYKTNKSNNKVLNEKIYPSHALYYCRTGYRSTQQHLSTFTSTGDVILDFYADWCGPCNRMSPLIDSLAATMPGFTFIKINRDFFLDLANIFNITSIPTLIFLRNGQEIGRYDGKPLTKHELAQLIIRVYNNK